MRKKKKIVISLFYLLILFFVVAISTFLYTNPNIREKLSFASSIGLSNEEPSSLPLPSYKFVKFENIQRPLNGEIRKFAEIEEGKVLIGGGLGTSGDGYSIFPAFWDQDGGLMKYYFKKEYRNGFFYDLNNKGKFSAIYSTKDEDNSYKYYAYLQDINSDNFIELKSPPSSSGPVPSTSLQMNERLLSIKKEFETRAPNGVGLNIFNLLYTPYSQIVPYSINSSGDVGGAVFSEKDGLISSIAVVWLTSKKYEPLDISYTISRQLGDTTVKKQDLWLIDDSKNIWASANIGGKMKLGYFEYATGNKWELKQSWDCPSNNCYTELRANNGKYSIVLQDINFQSNNSVYSKKGRTIFGNSKNPYEYQFRIEDEVQKAVTEKVYYITPVNLNDNNDLVGLFLTEDSIDYFVMNLETKSVKIFSELVESGSIQYPEDITLASITMIDDAGNLYVQFRGDSGNGVGMLKKF